jgi:hypothetical protein
MTALDYHGTSYKAEMFAIQLATFADTADSMAIASDAFFQL